MCGQFRPHAKTCNKRAPQLAPLGGVPHKQPSTVRSTVGALTQSDFLCYTIHPDGAHARRQLEHHEQSHEGKRRSVPLGAQASGGDRTADDGTHQSQSHNARTTLGHLKGSSDGVPPRRLGGSTTGHDVPPRRLGGSVGDPPSPLVAWGAPACILTPEGHTLRSWIPGALMPLLETHTEG